MPKKTKKQKIASQKRKLQVLEKPQAQPISVSSPLNEKTEEKISTPRVREPQMEMNTLTSRIFKKDLTKSLFISGAILFIVFGIYLQQQFGILPVSNLIK